MSRKKAPSRLLTDAVREVRNTRSRFLSLLPGRTAGHCPRHEGDR